MSSPQLQAALAGEHAAVYAYGVVGAWASDAARAQADADFTAHRARRDRLTTLLAAASQEPVAPAGGYQLPLVVDGPESARVLAATVEANLAALYADLVPVAAADLRIEAARWLADAAVRGALWSGTTPPFPGAPELG